MNETTLLGQHKHGGRSDHSKPLASGLGPAAAVVDHEQNLISRGAPLKGCADGTGLSSINTRIERSPGKGARPGYAQPTLITGLLQQHRARKRWRIVARCSETQFSSNHIGDPHSGEEITQQRQPLNTGQADQWARISQNNAHRRAGSGSLPKPAAGLSEFILQFGIAGIRHRNPERGQDFQEAG